MEKITAQVALQVWVSGLDGGDQRFYLGPPRCADREIGLDPGIDGTDTGQGPGAFNLPPVMCTPLRLGRDFIGDISRGAPCNIDTLNCVPHVVTHLETSAHILDRGAHSVNVADIPAPRLSGLAYLADLTRLGHRPGGLIGPADLQPHLEKITLPITILALKTAASSLPRTHDFSGQNFLALAPETAAMINARAPAINCLIVDLPSLDPESDGGKLLAHRAFLGLPDTGHHAPDPQKRAIVELAWFPELEEGHYHVVLTPQRFRTHAVPTGVYFYPLSEKPFPQEPGH